VSPAKTAEPIEMLFGLRTQVGRRNRVLDGGPDPWEGAVLSCAKTAEPIEMPFGIWIDGPKEACYKRILLECHTVKKTSHVLGGVHTDVHVRRRCGLLSNCLLHYGVGPRGPQA